MTAPDPYTTPSALKTLYTALANVDDGDLAALVDEYETWVEALKGTPYRVRTFTETVVDACDIRLPVVNANTVAVSAISGVDMRTGAAATGLPATNLFIPDGRRFLVPIGYLRPWIRYSVTYTAGRAEPPAGILRGCNLFVRNEATEAAGTFPANARNVTNDATGFSYALSTVDTAAGRPSRWLDVMAAVDPVPDESSVLVA